MHKYKAGNSNNLYSCAIKNSNEQIMHSEQIKLENNKLVGELRKSSSSKHLVIICHGYQGTRNNPCIVAIAKGLNKKGYAVFSFNFSNRKSDINIEQQVDDISLIVPHFHEYKNITLLAVSFGALSASITTTHLPAITGLITVNGFFGTGELGQGYRRSYLIFRTLSLINPKYYKIWKYYKKELQPGRIKVPVLVIHSRADKSVSISQSLRFYSKLLSPKHIIELKAADHNLSSSADIRLIIDEVDKWFKTIRVDYPEQ